MKRNRRNFIVAMGAGALAACSRFSPSGDPAVEHAAEPGRRKPLPQFGMVEQFDSALSEVIDPSAKLTKLADGFRWAEGPAWDRKRFQLYFSDVPQNKAFVWRDDVGSQVFLDPSGLPKGEDPAPFDSAGTNGLLIGREGRLLAASHGKRALTSIDIDSKIEIILSDRFEGKKLNSPNDLVEAADGTIFFTDPPYGLKGDDASPLKEQPVNGVYRRVMDGSLRLIDGGLKRPNGIALSPDQKTLYVANSDPERQILKSYAIAEDGGITDNGVFFDAQSLAGDDAPGLPDGMCVAETGHLFATGPGGVLILSPQGRLLGRINPGKACANCAFGNDGLQLYLTASDTLARIQIKVKGLGFR